MQLVSPDEISPVIRHANYADIQPGQSWGPRVIPDIELILILRGRFSYIDAQGSDVLLSAGDVLVIFPELEHTFARLGGSGRATMSCLHCELLPQMRYSRGDYRLIPTPRLVTHFGSYAELQALFAATARAFASRGIFKQYLAGTLARAVWLNLAELWAQETTRPGVSARMVEMQKFLQERFADPVTRHDLARRFQITPQYVNALFQAECGLTPGEYLNRYRVSLAQAMLAEGTSVKKTAIETGFCNAYYFSRVFKKYTSVSPSKFQMGEKKRF